MAVTAAIVTRVDVSTGATQVLAENNRGRRGLYIFNHSDQPLYIKCGPDATLLDFSVILRPNAFWEFPGRADYVGTVTALLEVADSGGAAMVTELYG